jgi:hypothetical protein
VKLTARTDQIIKMTKNVQTHLDAQMNLRSGTDVPVVPRKNLHRGRHHDGTITDTSLRPGACKSAVSQMESYLGKS